MNARSLVTRLMLVCITMMLSTVSLAGGIKMSEQEKEAWSVVESMWKDFAAHDSHAWTYFDENYTVWTLGNPLPVYPKTFKSWEEYLWTQFDLVKYELMPVKVEAVSDTLVIAHYFLGEDFANKEGEVVQYKTSRWTEFLQKKEGKWKLIGGTGGSVDEWIEW